MFEEITLCLYFEDAPTEKIVIEGEHKFSQIRDILSKREVAQYEVYAGDWNITFDYLDWYCL